MTRPTAKTSAIPNRYGELSERQMAREVRDQLNAQRQISGQLERHVADCEAEAAMLVGDLGSANKARAAALRERLEAVKATTAETIVKVRCATVTGRVSLRCDRIQGHAGEHLYSDTRDEHWEPRIPVEEMD